MRQRGQAFNHGAPLELMRPARSASRAVLLAFLCLAVAAPLRAQPRPQPIAPVGVSPPAPPSADALFLASFIVPGTAQYLQGDDRWVAYGAAELWGWLSYFRQSRAARTLERRYRDLAWRVPRRISVGERRDTVFEYYEAMAHIGASGAFDVEPLTPGVQPERQLGTFNGDLWELARGLHGGASAVPGTPAYDLALAYYLARAIPPNYSWAWGASVQQPLEQQVFADLIADSDEAFRSATRYLGLILANHIASAVDALVTARLRELGGGALRIELGSLPAADGVRFMYGMRIRF